MFNVLMRYVSCRDSRTRLETHRTDQPRYFLIREIYMKKCSLAQLNM